MNSRGTMAVTSPRASVISPIHSACACFNAVTTWDGVEPDSDIVLLNPCETCSLIKLETRLNFKKSVVVHAAKRSYKAVTLVEPVHSQLNRQLRATCPARKPGELPPPVCPY